MFAAGDFFYVTFLPDRKQITHCSAGIAKVLGYAADEIDVSFFERNVHCDDALAVKAYEKQVSEFFDACEPDERWRYKIQYDLRLKTKFGRFKKILHQSVPYFCTENGVPVQLSVFCDISHLKKSADQTLAIVDLTDGTTPKTLLSAHTQHPGPGFSRREKEVLALFVRGKTKTDIAAELFISEATVNNHLKNIRKKTRTRSLTELMARALEENRTAP